MAQTEDGRLISDELTEEGRMVIEHNITEIGLMVYGDEAIISADEGEGVEAIISRHLNFFDVGEGTDVISELSATLSENDVGTGIDEWSALLATIKQSDVGVGVEDLKVWMALLLKLLQANEINMELSHEKLLNMKLSQKQQEKKG